VGGAAAVVIGGSLLASTLASMGHLTPTLMNAG
jgi:hypothetical protein